MTYARLNMVMALAAGAVGCAGPCEDDGFGQTDCDIAVASQSGSTGGMTPTPSTSEAQTTAIPLPTSPTGGEQTGSTGTPDTDSADPSTSTETTGGGEESSESGDETGGSTSFCADVDGDGFGDPGDCTDVPDGDAAPSGYVEDNTDCDDQSDATFPGAAEQEPKLCALDLDDDGFGSASPPAGVDAGTDCIDDNDQAFPGAAPLDDPAACMEDADDDDYGDSMPPAGAMAGTDCNDNDVTVPVVNACLRWCRDGDNDQYGDGADCVQDSAPPMGYVGNDADCDDGDPATFPGAAQNESPTACMRDADDDGFGDDAAMGAITPGTDCDDLDAMVQAGCFDCPAGTLLCTDGDDLAQCNATGTFAFVIETCGFGCDDVGLACWPELTVDATSGGASCAEATAGSTVGLLATAAGGDGNYTYAWTPAPPLDDATAPSPTATIDATTTFEVIVGDGEGNSASDEVTVHLTGQDFDLQGPGCQGYVFPHPLGNPNPPSPTPVFFSGDRVYCNFAGDTAPHAWVCPTEYADARITFEMQVLIGFDNDVIGFVWGWQDAANFYVLSWKGGEEAAPWGTWEEGITIKRIQAPSPGAVTAEDLFAVADTPGSTLLAGPAAFYDQGWAPSTAYDVQLDTQSPSHTITIRQSSNGNLVTQGTVTDGSYPAGAVGSLDASQNFACNGFWESGCVP